VLTKVVWMGLCNGPGFVASALGAIILPPHRYEGMKWSSKLSFIQHYLWWRNLSQNHGLCNVRILDFCFVCLSPSETWQLLASGQNSRCLMSWAQYTFGCSQTSETCYFWDQFLAVCDTSLLSWSTYCVEKWPERSESVCSTHCLSVNFTEVHRLWLWWNQSVWICDRAGSLADEVADCVISERLIRLINKNLLYTFSSRRNQLSLVICIGDVIDVKNISIKIKNVTKIKNVCKRWIKTLPSLTPMSKA